jgi:hypothetical protein
VSVCRRGQMPLLLEFAGHGGPLFAVEVACGHDTLRRIVRGIRHVHLMRHGRDVVQDREPVEPCFVLVLQAMQHSTRQYHPYTQVASGRLVPTLYEVLYDIKYSRNKHGRVDLEDNDNSKA